METFDEVIAEMEKIIAWASQSNSRAGYFAALYKNITVLVRQATADGEFENPAQMEKLVAVFALRYFVALESHRQGRLSPQDPWHRVFEINATRKISIVQHLLLSINVHINYDLPIVCADLGPREKIIFLCQDYFKLNQILSSAIQGVEKGIFRLSPLVSVLARLVPKLERKLLNFSLNVARCKSWECACKQAIAAGQADRLAIIQGSVAGTEKLTRRILYPGFFALPLTFLISVLEFRSVKSNIRGLDYAYHQEVKSSSFPVYP
ncbi:MAG: DUF5995 family protein [Adhaeribacter sp.]